MDCEASPGTRAKYRSGNMNIHVHNTDEVVTCGSMGMTATLAKVPQVSVNLSRTQFYSQFELRSF